MISINELTHIEQSLPLVHAQKLGQVAGFSISNSVTTNLLTTLILLVIVVVFLIMERSGKTNKVSVSLEILYEQLYNFTNKITNNKHVTKMIISLVASLFLYLVIANTITSFPPFSFLNYNGIPLFRGQTSDFSTTFGIALTLVILANLKGVQSNGVPSYINEYIPIKDLLNNTIKDPKRVLIHLTTFILGLFIGILDIIGEMGKTLSVSLRLFGNMYAGQILMIISMSIFALVLPALMVFFNIFSGLLQALIFTALISVYFSTHHKVE